MKEAAPFVVTVASEKGGVGKTTIATNLAVYLKALREDLPVTIASFDNHFSIDHMFAIGQQRGASVAGLFAGVPVTELARMGEYGVQFLASEQELQPPDDDFLHLRRKLAPSALPGILIFDTRPILDYFTRNALLAADLVLVPVKDRPSLVNVASLQKALATAGGDLTRMWLLPSLVDARLKVGPEVGVRDLLLFAARERDYQVLETWIAKSPKVEGLATGFSARVRSVLTHARGTAVHRQFRDLAEFVLERFGARPAGSERDSADEGKKGCLQGPVCCGRTGGEEWGIFDLRRRRGRVHADCLAVAIEAADLPPLEEGNLLALRLEGAGLAGPQPELFLHLFDAGGGEIAAGRMAGAEEFFTRVVEGVAGRRMADLYRETLIISGDGGTRRGKGAHLEVADLQRQILRELLRR